MTTLKYLMDREQDLVNRIDKNFNKRVQMLYRLDEDFNKLYESGLSINDIKNPKEAMLLTWYMQYPQIVTAKSS